MTAMAAVALAILVPHALPLGRARASSAIAIWLSALVLRALLSVLAAAVILTAIPGSAVFNQVASWCWHAILPGAAAHLGIDGHRIVMLALGLPLVTLGFWALGHCVRIVRAHHVTRQILRDDALGQGPFGSVIVGGGGVFVASAGLLRPKVVLSTGALAQLDDEELAAGVAHERGHIVRHHRWILVAAEVCRSVGRFLPGNRFALEQLRAGVERDADDWAVSRTSNPLALASAICKAASVPPGPVVTALGGSGTVARVDRLIEIGQPPPRWSRALSTSLAVAMISLSVGFALAVTPAAANGVQNLQQHPSSVECET